MLGALPAGRRRLWHGAVAGNWHVSPNVSA
jgi:hypothetical protein